MLVIAAPETYDQGTGVGDHGDGLAGGHGNADGNGLARVTDSTADGRPGVPSATNQLSGDKRLATSLRGEFAQGTVLQSETSSFRNLGQFVASVPVGSDLGIPFSQLTRRIMEGGSLGQAIDAIKHGIDSGEITDDALKHAQKQVATQ